MTYPTDTEYFEQMERQDDGLSESETRMARTFHLRESILEARTRHSWDWVCDCLALAVWKARMEETPSYALAVAFQQFATSYGWPSVLRVIAQAMESQP